MKICIASDSYKGSLDSLQVAHSIKKGIDKVLDNVEYKIIPMADGGEGTVDVLLQILGGHYVECEVCGPMHDKVKAKYGITPNHIGFIEMASASGLPLVGEHKDILQATTYGTGELIKDCLNQGCHTIYIGIGGSATNDGGVGMAQALGISFQKENGEEICLGVKEINQIHSIDTSHLDSRITNTKIIILCDVTNPLCGIHGASYVYARQKGASEELLPFLDQSLEHLSTFYPSFKDVEGAGAAGGLGFGLLSFLHGKIQSGIETVLELADFDSIVQQCDFVITGEGRIDSQSIHGKVPIGIAKHAKKYNKPVVAIVGCIGDDAKVVYEHGIDTIESCVYQPCTLQDAMQNAERNVMDAAERVMRSICIGQKLD